MKKQLFVVTTMATLVTACSSTPPYGSAEYAAQQEQQRQKILVKQAEQTIDKAPDWFLQPPSDSSYMYAVATDYSSDLQFALDKAILNAKVGLAAQVSNKVSSTMKEFAVEAGVGQDAQFNREVERASKEVISEVNLGGFNVAKRQIMPQGMGYRAYVLLRIPVVDMNKAIVEQTKKNSALDAKLKATKAFQELEKDIANSQQVAQESPQTPAAAPEAPPATQTISKPQEGTAVPLKDAQ